ncbi:unnamed protein product, partial [Effrenium voratum]
MLSQLVLVNGFLSDANLPGVEKLCCTAPRARWLTSPLNTVKPVEFGAGSNLLDGGAVFLVKGWSRSVCALAIMFASYEEPQLLQAGSLSAIHITVVEAEDSVVNTNRGITMASAIRRKPNAFNLLHQLLFLQRTGLDAEASEAHLKELLNGKFLHHEPVAAGVFNLGYSSGVEALLARDPCLQNTPELLDLVCTRLERDWNSLAPKMRRAWGLKE